MKRIALFLVSISLLFASCEKTPQDEWNRFYGFTKDDIVGHYNANPDESLYEALPTPGVAVYDNASIDIQALSDNQVSLHIVIPGTINKVFSGAVIPGESTSDMMFVNDNNEDISMTVYKNSQNQVRLHGRVKRYHYDAHHILEDSDNWGFDVIKE